MHERTNLCRRLRRGGVGLAAATALALGVASAALAITGGAPDGGAHPYVGAAIGPAAGGSGSALCSGSAISATVVVTAAHCFADGSRARVTFADQAKGAAYTHGTVHDYPGYCDTCANGLPRFDSNDVAVIVLDAPVALPRYASLPAAGADGSLGGAAVTLVGYGAQDVPNPAPQNAPEPSGLRTAVQTRVIPGAGAVGDQYLKLAASQGGACFGDSGGPVLVGDTAYAVNAYAAGNPQCGGNTYAQRLDLAPLLRFVRGF